MKVDKDLTYEEKMWLLGVIKDRIDTIEERLILKRVNIEKKCPHRNTVNMTTFADPEGMKVMLCMDCNAELIYQNGILVEVKGR